MSFKRERAPLRRINVHGHPTSIRIEQKWWNLLREIAGTRGVTIKSVLEELILANKGKESLASALRYYIAQYFRNQHGPYYFLDVTRGTRRPSSQRSRISIISDTGRPPRPRAA
jgi:predicted DNA-binding ribbon-helix-helix protein